MKNSIKFWTQEISKGKIISKVKVNYRAAKGEESQMKINKVPKKNRKTIERIQMTYSSKTDQRQCSENGGQAMQKFCLYYLTPWRRKQNNI